MEELPGLCGVQLGGCHITLNWRRVVDRIHVYVALATLAQGRHRRAIGTIITGKPMPVSNIFLRHFRRVEAARGLLWWWKTEGNRV